MSTRSPYRPEQLWLAVPALVLLCALVLGALWVAGVHTRAKARLAEIEPRHARLAGLLQSDEQLKKAGDALQGNLTQFLHPVDADAGLIGNAVLQRVRELASAQDLRVTSSQVSAPTQDKDHPGFEQVGLSVRLEGDWGQLQRLLAALPRERPVIYSRTVQLLSQGARAPAQAQLVQAQLDLFVLKERQP